MDVDKESVSLAKTVLPGEEVIKTSVGFKKGLIAGILILVLVLLIGVLLGYAMGQNVATAHYSEILENCQAKAFLPW